MVYIVAIMFDAKSASKKQLIYNEIYLSIVEKRKLLNLKKSHKLEDILTLLIQEFHGLLQLI